MSRNLIIIGSLLITLSWIMWHEVNANFNNKKDNVFDEIGIIIKDNCQLSIDGNVIKYVKRNDSIIITNLHEKDSINNISGIAINFKGNNPIGYCYMSAPKWNYRIRNILNYLGLSLLFLGLFLICENINIKYLMFLIFSLLFFGLFIQYSCNNLLEFLDIKFMSGQVIDNLLKTRYVISFINYTTLLCLLILLLKRHH